jgi:hypothetical protein
MGYPYSCCCIHIVSLSAKTESDRKYKKDEESKTTKSSSGSAGGKDSKQGSGIKKSARPTSQSAASATTASSQPSFNAPQLARLFKMRSKRLQAEQKKAKIAMAAQLAASVTAAALHQLAATATAEDDDKDASPNAAQEFEDS